GIVIEVGAGYASGASLDTNDIFVENSIQGAFIEPEPQLLRSLLKSGDAERINLLEKNLQDVNSAVFADLQANDILFIDSSHVAKIDSDVNDILFRIRQT